MNGYWYVVGLSLGICIVAKHYENYLIAIPLFIWIFLLYYFKRLGKIPVLFSLTCFLFFSIYLPDLHQLAPKVEYPDQTIQVVGKIISPIESNPKMIQFTFYDQQTEEKIQ